MIKRSRKMIFLGIMGVLTSTAITACYWQTSKYFKSIQRWKTINEELAVDQPTDLCQLLTTNQLYPFKYVKCEGSLSPQYILVDRLKGDRLGYLIVRKLKYMGLDASTRQPCQKNILVCDGWVPERLVEFKRLIQQVKFNGTPTEWKGLLKGTQKIDYRSQSADLKGLVDSQIRSYISVVQLSKELNINPDSLNSKYYVEVFQQGSDVYPVRPTKRDFELPYLTPQKHKGYAMFWGGATLVGLLAMGIAIGMH